MKTKPNIYQNRGIFAKTMLHKYFSQSPNKIVSDIGAGFGHMETSVVEIGGTWQPFDYVQKIDKTTIWDLNCTAPKDASNAGIVLFLEVLEHLPNPLLSLQHISNHMEKGGYLILTVPNPQSAKNRLNLLLKGTLYAFQKKHLKEHHVFTPWEHVVRFYLEQVGFKIVEYAIVDTDYQKLKITSFKSVFKYMLEKLIEFKNYKAQGMSYGIVAKKIS